MSLIHTLLIDLAEAGPSTPKRSRLIGTVPSPANARVDATGSATIQSTTRYSLTAREESKLVVML